MTLEVPAKAMTEALTPRQEKDIEWENRRTGESETKALAPFLFLFLLRLSVSPILRSLASSLRLSASAVI
jgi:hypothetical protein